MTEYGSKPNWRDWLAYGLFWSWNLVFLAFMGLGFAPRLLPDLLIEVRQGTIPVQFLFYALVLTLVPLLAVILGLTVLRESPSRLVALGYVVEGPLMLLLVIRFFVIRQAPASLVYLLLVAGLGMAAFLWHTLDPEVERRGPLASFLRLVGLTLMLLTALYAALWIAFYAVPLAGAALEWLGRTLANLPGFFSGLWRDLGSMVAEGLAWIPVILLGFVLVIYTLTLFALAPLVIPALSWRAWWRSWRALVARAGWVAPLAVVAITLLVSGALFVLSNHQPQKQAFALLEEPPSTASQAQALLQSRGAIRAGLLNAYLAPFRYFSAQGEVRHVSTLYRDVFGLPEPYAFKVQGWYESVARPLLYDPVHPQTGPERRDNVAFQAEPRQAAELYQRFFDTPIADAERQAIVAAVRSTWSGEQAEAAWQAVDDREIHLLQQEINLVEHGDWAEVELLEVYQNQTAQQQEVIYYFNLPESAVITGLWLGDGPERDRRFAYQVAPRGAAQAVYRNEVRRNIDPALLEQIGPRQYRLRAFPVPPQRFTWDTDGTRRSVVEAPRFYLWLTYVTLAEDESWSLPQLAYGRNVYWDADTVRLLNGAAWKVQADAWLPDAIPASQPVTAGAHRVDFPAGQSVLVSPLEAADRPSLPADMKLALVLDRSYSMQANAGQVSGVLAELRALTGENVDVYLTASEYRGEGPERVTLAGFQAADVMYFGGQNATELLAQYAALRNGRTYDAVLVLTDDSGYELGPSPAAPQPSDAPVWLVHLGGGLPLGYDDRTLEVIQASGGGVSGSLEAALERLAYALAAQPGAGESGWQDALDGYRWQVLPSSHAEAAGVDPQLHTGDGFAALAARQVILAEMRAVRGELDQLENLDRLHALAQEYGIVTPYSSMIVLVNVNQQRLLDDLSELEGRFTREVEDLGDTLPATQTPLRGVPEPEEWLLLSLVAAMLVWFLYRQRFVWQRS